MEYLYKLAVNKIESQITHHYNLLRPFSSPSGVGSYLKCSTAHVCSKNVLPTCLNMSCNNNPTHKDTYIDLYIYLIHVTIISY